MKSFLPAICAGAILFSLCGSLHADEPKPAAPTPPEKKWNVRVEVLMVAMPEEKALSLLPDLRNEATVDATTAALLDTVKRKEPGFILTGYPEVMVVAGQEGTAETNVEKIYPTQFEVDGSPTNFEKRNMGPMLQVRASHVSEDGTWIQFDAQASRTELLGFDFYDASPTKDGKSIGKIGEPLFFSSKNSETLTLRNGQRILMGIHKLTKPEGAVELFILQATAKLTQ